MMQFDLGVVLQPLEDVQPAPAPVPLELVRTVGDPLQFLQHEAGHDHPGIHDASIAHIRDPAVDDHARIEHERLVPLHLLGKFDIRDNEAKFVAGLQER